MNYAVEFTFPFPYYHCRGLCIRVGPAMIDGRINRRHARRMLGMPVWDVLRIGGGDGWRREYQFARPLHHVQAWEAVANAYPAIRQKVIEVLMSEEATCRYAVSFEYRPGPPEGLALAFHLARKDGTPDARCKGVDVFLPAAAVERAESLAECLALLEHDHPVHATAMRHLRNHAGWFRPASEAYMVGRDYLLENQE